MLGRSRLALLRIGLLNQRSPLNILRYTSGHTDGWSHSQPSLQLLSLQKINSLTNETSLLSVLPSTFSCSNHFRLKHVSFESLNVLYGRLQNPIEELRLPGLDSHFQAESNDVSYSCLSVLKQRRKKMKKHKYKKWRKRMRFVRKAHGR